MVPEYLRIKKPCKLCLQGVGRHMGVVRGQCGLWRGWFVCVAGGQGVGVHSCVARVPKNKKAVRFV